MVLVHCGIRDRAAKGDVPVGAHIQLCRFQPCPCVGLWEQRAAFTVLTPRRDRHGEFLGCFYGLQPMHRESRAPSNLLPLKALHSHPGWKEVKEKATHVFKCKGTLLHGGLGCLPKTLPAWLARGEGTQPGWGLGRQLSCGQAALQRP